MQQCISKEGMMVGLFILPKRSLYVLRGNEEQSNKQILALTNTTYSFLKYVYCLELNLYSLLGLQNHDYLPLSLYLLFYSQVLSQRKEVSTRLKF